jgi:ribosome-associated heat shock protein Hsp15
MPDSNDPVGVRADRWLWAARAFRSRSLAAEACDGGKVEINGARAKAHKSIRPGDTVVLTTPVGRRTLRVVALSERRGPAATAHTLYDDLTPPPPPEEIAAPRRDAGAGRPSKRERRELDRWRRG